MNHTHRHTHTILGAVVSGLFALPGAALAAEPAPGEGLLRLAPIPLFILIFYFLLIRPQQKRLKAHQALVSALKKGDKVVTGGGIYGTVRDVSEETVNIEVADNVRIKVKRSTITSLAE